MSTVPPPGKMSADAHGRGDCLAYLHDIYSWHHRSVNYTEDLVRLFRCSLFGVRYFWFTCEGNYLGKTYLQVFYFLQVVF